MAAFSRRTTFAAPVILTVVACSSGKQPAEPKQFPGTTWVVAMTDMKCFATETGRGNPPAPQQAIECPPGMSGRTVLTVGQLPTKDCAIVPAGCVDAKCTTHRTPCPLPPGKQVVRTFSVLWKIEKRGPDCHAEDETDCPPGADCNPPAPRHFPCPAGVSEQRDLHVAELPDATCVIVPEGCTDTGCATEKIDCPPH